MLLKYYSGSHLTVRRYFLRAHICFENNRATMYLTVRDIFCGRIYASINKCAVVILLYRSYFCDVIIPRKYIIP